MQSGTGGRWRFQRRGLQTRLETRVREESALGAGAEEGEGVEVGVGVVGVGVFGALEEVDDEVGERGGDDLVGDLEAIAGEDEPLERGGG